jgi:hypothetical protein
MLDGCEKATPFQLHVASGCWTRWLLQSLTHWPYAFIAFCNEAPALSTIEHDPMGVMSFEPHVQSKSGWLLC